MQAAQCLKVQRPALLYHGGKWRIAPWIIDHFPAHREYVEPFGGGASVLLRKPRAKSEVYNDLDGEIVGLFRVLRDPAQSAELERQLRLTPFAREEYDAAFEKADDPVESARRLIIRSYMGHSSNSATRDVKNGFRSQRMGSNNPSTDFANYPSSLQAVTARLLGVVIEKRPALQVVEQYDSPEALIYCDPPYPRSTRTTNHASYRHEMSDAEHELLAETLAGVQGMVVVSGYRCELYDRIFAGWPRVSMSTRAACASPRQECLWLNPRAWNALPRAIPLPLMEAR